MKKKILMLIIIALLTLPVINVDAKEKVAVNVFYGQTCSYCHNLLSYLENLKNDKTYGELFEIKKYEVWYNETNEELAKDVANYLNVKMGGVPFYIIGSTATTGFLESTHGEEIKNNIKKAYDNNEKDVVEIVKESKTTTTKNINSLTQATKTTKTYQTTIKTTTKSTITVNTTTTKQEFEIKDPVQDKNGNLPEDIIKKFLNGINNGDTDIMNYVSDRAKEEDFNEKDFLEKIKNSNFNYEINGYTYHHNEYIDDEYVDGESWLYIVRMEGNIGEYKLTPEEGNGEVLIRLIDGEYFIDDFEMPIELSPEDMWGIIKEIFAAAKEDMGPGIYMFIPFILIILVSSLFPLIITIVIIISIIKAAKRKKIENENLINQGVINPDDNGQV